MIQKCCIDVNKSDLYLNAIIGLVGDLGDCYGDEVNVYLVSLPFITSLLEEGATSTNIGTHRNALWARRAIGLSPDISYDENL